MPPGSTPLACSSIDDFKIKYQIATSFVKTKEVFFNYNRCFGHVLISERISGVNSSRFSPLFFQSLIVVVDQVMLLLWCYVKVTCRASMLININFN